MKNKKILLTGGSGFIGRNILESDLNKKYSIIAPRHNDLDLLDEMSVSNFFKQNKFDIIIHSACKPGHRNAKDPNGIYYAKTRMFFNLARFSNQYEKMIVMGSGGAYDRSVGTPKIKETDIGKIFPKDEHDFASNIIGNQSDKSKNIYDLRIFGIFGKYEDYAIRFISNAICKSIFDLPITLNQNRKFDYLYINDLFPVLEYIIEASPQFHSYNITPNNAIELLEIANIVKKISGSKHEIKVKKKGLGTEYSGSNSRLKNEISELQLTPIQYAIEELYIWYLGNKNNINKELLLQDK